MYIIISYVIGRVLIYLYKVIIICNNELNIYIYIYIYIYIVIMYMYIKGMFHTLFW